MQNNIENKRAAKPQYKRNNKKQASLHNKTSRTQFKSIKKNTEINKNKQNKTSQSKPTYIYI